jgi:hypothetical protein
MDRCSVVAWFGMILDCLANGVRMRLVRLARAARVGGYTPFAVCPPRVI